jgi:hypothetical protein
MKTPVVLTYFNRSGVAFSYEYFDTEQTTMEALIFDINVMRDDGRLVQLAGREEDSYIFVSFEDAQVPWSYPHLILPPFLKDAVRLHWATQSDRPVPQ